MEERQTRVGYVTVTRFLEDAFCVSSGIEGYLWPDNELVTVRFAYDPTKAWRPSFESLRHPPSQTKALREGGIVRMPLTPTDAHTYTTDCPHIVTYTGTESLTQMVYGMGSVRAYTPSAVIRKRTWLARDPEGQKHVAAWMEAHPGLSKDLALEEVLQKAMKGQNRYVPYVTLFDLSQSFEGKNAKSLRRKLLAFFADPDFRVLPNTNGILHQPIKPRLLLRRIDASGCVSASQGFSPEDAANTIKDRFGHVCQRSFLAVHEQVEVVLARMRGWDHWDVLPGKVYAHSTAMLRMGSERGKQAIRTLFAQHSASHCQETRGCIVERVRRMGLHIADDGSNMVVETLCDISQPGLDPLIMKADGSLYPRKRPEENNTPDERPSPSFWR